ncbi:MAG TPA: hypothetical protein VEK10_02780 [Steroidobacteraceae bacterium]|nr:hypothetical protein [Steroidobacteraceae bacterium]
MSQYREPLMITSPSEFIRYFIGRFDGPLHFRFIAQPLMAILLAMRDGWRDARAGRSALAASPA